MAEPIQASIEAPPPPHGPRHELERLLGTLHEHGLLRLANDLVAAQQGVAEVLLRGLNAEGSRNAMQNVSVLAMLLSQIPPAQFYKLSFALKHALERLLEEAETGDRGAQAPGARGLWRSLNDERLWSAVLPLVKALESFGEAMRKPSADKPITEFSGKPGGS